MAFFTNKQQANNSTGAVVPTQNDNDYSQGNILQFTPRANDTFQADYGNNIQLNRDLDIQQHEDGLKSVTPKLDLVEPEVAPDLVKITSEPEDAIEEKFNNLIPNQDMFGSYIDTTPAPQLPNPSKLETPNSDLSLKNYTIDEILAKAIELNASDVHLSVGYRAIIRIDGMLKSFNSSILTSENIVEFVKELVKYRNNVDLETLTDLDLNYSLGERRFRVNIFKQSGNFSIVFRVIAEKISTIEDLNLPPVLKEFTKFPNGLVLLTGPTGSGKSTTLASILNHINLTKSKHIVTLEDPIEYVFPKSLSIIDQREYGIDFTSYPEALRAVLRQDPDIVLIGEMRDLESIEAAMQVADTGHLVFATLHTNSASQTIDRIIDVFPSQKQDQIRVQLASVLRAVVAQRLVPVAQGGRMPVSEILIANSAVKSSVRDKKVFLLDNIIQTSSNEGMVSLEKSLVNLVKRGYISSTTAKALSLKPKEIDILLQS